MFTMQLTELNKWSDIHIKIDIFFENIRFECYSAS